MMMFSTKQMARYHELDLELKKSRRFTPYNIRKKLAEALILSKLDYCNVSYHGMPDYLRRLQKVENAEAGFVQGGMQ